MTNTEITTALQTLLFSAITESEKKAIIAEFEDMGDAGAWPISHYVKMFLPESLKGKAKQVTTLLLGYEEAAI